MFSKFERSRKDLGFPELQHKILPFGGGNEWRMAQFGSLKTEVRTDPSRKEHVRQKAVLTRRGSLM